MYLLTLSLKSTVETKYMYNSRRRNIFDVKSECCYTIWQTRNDIIFKYKVLSPDSIGAMAHILKRKCKVLHSDNLKNRRAGEVVGE